MRIVGPDPLQARELSVDLPRAVALIRGAPPGRVVVATRHEGALTRAALATFRAGRALLPLDPAAPGREVGPLLQGAGLLLLDPEPAARWPLPIGSALRLVTPQARPSAWQRLIGRRATVDGFPGCLAEFPSVEVDPPAAESTALLLGTSGTTGSARLVPWTHAALAAQQRILVEALDVDERSRLLNLLPTHHIDGMVMGLLLAAGAGATLIRPASRVLDLGALLDAVWAETVTHLVLTPAVLALLLRVGEDLRQLFANDHFRMFVSTAAPLPDPVWRRVEELTDRPVVNVYGLTETGNLLFAGPDPGSRRVGTVGRPRGVELRIRAADGQDAAPGQEGEIQLRGPTVMRAWEDGTSPLVDGWYPTGDLGAIDADGCVRVLGRIKAMLSVGGLKVAPGEVERALLEHPAVRDARVSGEPDPVWGERVVAAVVADGVEVDALTAWLRERLSEHKLPRALRLVDHLGRGETGKIPTRVAESVADRVLAVAARAFRIPVGALSLGARAGEVPGWDSLGHLDLVLGLEAAFQIRITGRDLMRIRTLADAVALVEARAVA